MDLSRPSLREIREVLVEVRVYGPRQVTFEVLAPPGARVGEVEAAVDGARAGS
jgi:hypothetical protein